MRRLLIVWLVLMLLMPTGVTIAQEAPPECDLIATVEQLRFVEDWQIAIEIVVRAFDNLSDCTLEEIIEATLSGQMSDEIQEEVVIPPSETQQFAAGEIPVSGNPDAPITIAVVYDYTCPHCASYHGTFEALRIDFDEEANFMIYQVAMSSRAPESERAIEAATCAAEQGYFWDMHDALFDITQDEGLPGFTVENMATAVPGMDDREFFDCMDRTIYDGTAVTELMEAESITGTPTVMYRLEDGVWRFFPENGSTGGGRPYGLVAERIRAANED
jgi:protein-disulfide isomerase